MTKIWIQQRQLRLLLLPVLILLGGMIPGIIPAQPVSVLLAQPSEISDDPLFFIHADTLWRWSPAAALQPISEIFPNLVNAWLAPDGMHILLKTTSEHVKTLAAQECPCGGTIPDGREFWLLEIATGKSTRLTPDYAEFTTLSEVPVLSDPLWSPDGTQVAWAQGLESSDLIVYDLAADQTTVAQTGIPSQSRVSNVAALTRWTHTGIWVERVRFEDDLNDLPGGYAIYHPAGGIAAEIPPYTELAGLPDVKMFDGMPAYNTYNHFVVDFSGFDLLITHSLTGWQSLDLTDGQAEPVTTGPVMQVSAVGSWFTSIRVTPPVYDSSRQTLRRTIYSPEWDILGEIPFMDPLLTRDGSALVQQQKGSQFRLLFSDGTVGTYELPWEPRIIPTPTRLSVVDSNETLVIGAHCEGNTLSFRFPILPFDGSSDLVGHVLGDSPNNLRATPGRDGTLTGELHVDESFEVTAGPVCNDGIAWWQVKGMNGQSGWTAEGADGEYFIAPGCSVDYCNAEG